MRKGKVEFGIGIGQSLFYFVSYPRFDVKCKLPYYHIEYIISTTVLTFEFTRRVRRITFGNRHAKRLIGIIVPGLPPRVYPAFSCAQQGQGLELAFTS